MSSPSNARELAAAIEARIAAGELKAGDRLDPVRAVAESSGLAANTVAAAYRALGERGLVQGRGRRGTFVSARPSIASFVAADRVPSGVVDLATGNPDRRLLPDLGPALTSISSSPVAYEDPAVDPRLGDLLAADLAADGVAVGELCVVGGALDGIERILVAHLRPGDRVAIEDPGYASVVELVAAMGLRAVSVPVDAQGPTPDGVAAAVADGVEAFVITPRAHNPTGAAIDRPRAVDLASALDGRPEVLVIVDDHAGAVAGAPFVIPPALDDRERWAVVRSVAKSLGPDLRLAALAGDATTVSRVAGRQSLGTGWVSHLLQRIVAQLLSSAEVTARLGEAAEAYATRRRVVVDVLAASGVEGWGRSGLNVWVPVDDEAAVVAGMVQRGYGIRSGARFRRRAGPGVRLSIGGAGLTELEAAAEALADLLTSSRQTRRA